MRTIVEIIETIDTRKSREETWPAFLDELLSNYEGNIIEVGSGYGVATEMFCKAARKHNRKVLTIDPFEEGWEEMPESYRYRSDKMNELLARYSNLELYKFPSQHSSVLGKALQYDTVAFIFLDGLQTKEAVLSDLKLAENVHPAIICLDDADRLSEISRVPEALAEYKGDYKIVKQGREAYLCL